MKTYQLNNSEVQILVHAEAVKKVLEFTTHVSVECESGRTEIISIPASSAVIEANPLSDGYVVVPAGKQPYLMAKEDFEGAYTEVKAELPPGNAILSGGIGESLPDQAA